MQMQNNAITFLSQYPEPVATNALLLRELLLKTLPNIIEQVDLPAKMVAYCYGQKYADMACTIIPSKKGLKLGFYKGNELPGPANLLQGTGKLSRYAIIETREQTKSKALKQLAKDALAAYHQRMQ